MYFFTYFRFAPLVLVLILTCEQIKYKMLICENCQVQNTVSIFLSFYVKLSIELKIKFPKKRVGFIFFFHKLNTDLGKRISQNYFKTRRKNLIDSTSNIKINKR